MLCVFVCSFQGTRDVLSQLDKLNGLKELNKENASSFNNLTCLTV